MNVSTNASASVNNGATNTTASVCINNSSVQGGETQNIDPETAKFAYEKAIEAYQFHVNRYKDWMNLYAIFTGAMFVGLYSITEKTFQGVEYIVWIICGIGLIASICWWMSQTGYYNWLLSWTDILHQREKDYFGEVTYVYRKISPSFGRFAKNGCIPKFISTQKISTFFIQVTVFGWLTIIYCLAESFICGLCSKVVFGMALLIVFCMVKFVINYSTSKLYSSSVGNMLEQRS